MDNDFHNSSSLDASLKSPGDGIGAAAAAVKLGFSEDEKTLIKRMFGLVGERWALIAGRIPGRTAEEIHVYWTSSYSTS